MRLCKIFLLFQMSFLLNACSSGEPEVAGSSATRELAIPTSVSSTTEDAPVPIDHNSSVIGAPTTDNVLYSIYERDGGGTSSYEVDYGSRVTYWYGHQFELQGRHYFTGFAYKTSEKVTDQGKETAAGPSTAVAISQATYELNDPQAKTPWRLLETDGFIGEFGSYDKPLEIDETRQPLVYKTRDGRILLAVPTSNFMTGVSSASFSLFVFDPSEIEKLREKHWAYVGNIVTGQDNEAACDAGNVMPCVSSTGTLTFRPGEGPNGLPRLHVAMAGTTIVSAGKIRELGALDAATYLYDAKQASYTP